MTISQQQQKNLQLLSTYTAHRKHYPRIAEIIRAHYMLYEDCMCDVWMEIGNQTQRYREYFDCSNCRVWVWEENAYPMKTIENDIFMKEYASYVMNVTEGHRLQLCQCCYESFKKDFLALA